MIGALQLGEATGNDGGVATKDGDRMKVYLGLQMPDIT